MLRKVGPIVFTATVLGCGTHDITFTVNDSDGGNPSGSSGGTSSTMTGSSGSAPPVGTGGAGGGPIKKTDMLSDFEPDRGFSFNKNPQWSGEWAVSGDTSPNGEVNEQLEALVPARTNDDGSVSTQAVHVTENGQHLIWGSSFFAYLRGGRSMDASAYSGIEFRAKSDGGDQTIKVSVTDLGSWPSVMPPEIQVCDINDTSVGGRGCFDYYAVRIVPGAEWQHYVVPFSTLSMDGWGLAHAFDASHVYSIMFSGLPKIPYSEWIDDVAFYSQ